MRRIGWQCRDQAQLCPALGNQVEYVGLFGDQALELQIGKALIPMSST